MTREPERSRVQLETEERLTVRIPLDELLAKLTSSERLDLSDFEHRGRLLDWPDAWRFTHLTVAGVDSNKPHAVLVFTLSENEALGLPL